MWAFDLPEDCDVLDEYAAPFHDRGARVLYLELEASQTERLARNSGEFRLREKPSKRDLEWSTGNLLSVDGQYRLNSSGEFDDRDDYLRLDNTHLTPREAADRTVAHFKLADVQ